MAIKSGILFLTMTLILLIFVFIFVPNIPQWQSYHQFADTRTFLGIPNFYNVISNIPFFIVSIIGFISLKQQWFKHYLTIKEMIVLSTFFTAVLLVGVGSSYYHLNPNNATLVWDRMPITIIFTSLLSFTMMERMNNQLGFWSLPFLLIAGIGSVEYWHWTELLGRGDLRLYGFVEYYSILLILMILYFYPKPYPPLKAYLWMFVLFTFAKITENADILIYHLGGIVSGHTLKHLFAAAATYCVVVMVNKKSSILLT